MPGCQGGMLSPTAVVGGQSCLLEGAEVKSCVGGGYVCLSSVHRFISVCLAWIISLMPLVCFGLDFVVFNLEALSCSCEERS